MKADLTRELKQAASSTFEMLGFLLPEDDITEEQAQAPVTASSRVRFRGPSSGVMEVEVAGGFLEELASNMLGLERDSVSKQVAQDALGEVANVICGNALPALGGAAAVFDLSAPETTDGPLAPCARPEGSIARAILGLDGGRAEITLRLYG